MFKTLKQEAPRTARPLDAAELALMLPVQPGKRIAVAVSGGPDSMALALLLRDWARAYGRRVTALIVDHRLRPESAGEAARVGAWLGAAGVENEILVWEHGGVTRAIQENARVARYRLLLEACHRHGITDLLLAHHAGDQAETLLMRLAKGTGIDGLAGMRAATKLGGINLLRPLLDVPKERLIATCEAHGQDYVTDPGNNSGRFARGRLRGAMQALAAEGLDIDRLRGLAARAASASDALSHYTQELLARCAAVDAAGCATLDIAAMRTAPLEIQLRALSAMLQLVAGKDGYGPKHEPLLAAWRGLLAEDEAARTLHGCELHACNGMLTILREPAAINDRQGISGGETIVWDGRFTVTLHDSEAPEGLIVGPLGTQPHAQLDEIAPGLRKAVARGKARAALPALWRDGDLWAVPLPGKEAKNISVSASFVR
ncbi:MAG: tRNA lysidine(34) synthetase TilS [Alphaproteobacteria bacterium]|nr:tRNA lysidine(34) synthetase TilS [Alphaproteobacteria bacterium]